MDRALDGEGVSHYIAVRQNIEFFDTIKYREHFGSNLLSTLRRF